MSLLKKKMHRIRIQSALCTSQLHVTCLTPSLTYSGSVSPKPVENRRAIVHCVFNYVLTTRSPFSEVLKLRVRSLLLPPPVLSLNLEKLLGNRRLYTVAALHQGKQ